jgi:thiamine-monophosphate kinase
MGTKERAPENPRLRSELDMLAQIRARARSKAKGSLALGIGDDCALLRLRPGEELAVTTDLSIDGRHFRLAWHPAESIGHRALARGLSDLAAMGARPVAAFLSLGLPAHLVQGAKAGRGRQASGRNTSTGKTWLDRFLDGFFALADAYGVPLAGGDLAESPVAVADIVLTGAVRRGKALLRSGARPGDALYVTNALGGAAAGLGRLEELRLEEFGDRIERIGDPRSSKRSTQPASLKIPAKLELVLHPHLYPAPRVAQGLALVRRRLATAAIDLSDGLSTDLDHLCAESGVAAEVEAAALPVAAGATLAQALHGGEDYELLFAAAPHTRVPRELAGVAVTRIGHVLPRRRNRPVVTLVDADGPHTLEPRGWEHFS